MILHFINNRRMFIETRISTGICGLVDQHGKICNLIKTIDDQFVTLNKILASTLIMKFSSMRLTSVCKWGTLWLNWRILRLWCQNLYLCTISWILFHNNAYPLKSYKTHIKINGKSMNWWPCVFKRKRG
jgi:hypothetical protein